MSKELPFMVLCVEEYKNQKGLTGKEVMTLFNKYSVCEYIQDFYEVLHTTGAKYIVNDNVLRDKVVGTESHFLIKSVLIIAALI